MHPADEPDRRTSQDAYRRMAGHCGDASVLQRCYSHPIDKATGVRSDRTVILTAELWFFVVQ